MDLGGLPETQAVFLNQILLSNKGDGPKLAKQLIDLYFSLFKAVTSVVDEEDHDSKSKRKKGDKDRKRGFGKGMNKGSTNAKEKENAANFMMEIDSRLLSALLTAEIFLGLVYKSLKSDVDTKRITAFAKRLIQVKTSLV
ncbi:unnamed protein product [Calypogeia fissa]